MGYVGAARFARVGLIDTGSGRVMLAFQTVEQRAQMLAEHTKVKGEVTIDREALEAACERIRAAGFSQKDSQQTFGVTDVTFPVLGPSGRAIAALTCPYLKRIDEYVAPTLAAVNDAAARNGAGAFDVSRADGLRCGGSAVAVCCGVWSMEFAAASLIRSGPLAHMV